MRKSQLKAVRGKKIEEIKLEIREKKRELAKFLANLAAGKEKNVKKGKNLKKEIAQMITIVKEKEFSKG